MQVHVFQTLNEEEHSSSSHTACTASTSEYEESEDDM